MRTLDIKKVIEDIQDWIKSYLKSANAKGIIVCVSGGIDSAVTLGLCVGAIGKENITTLILPCESNLIDEEDAKLVINHFNVKSYRFDLTSVYRELLKIFKTQIKGNNLSRANIKPRLRMVSAYFSGQSLKNHLVVGTGNRTEDAIGYFTKYGDGGADFLPIGDLYKCEVRAIGKELGIPEKIITKAPSAGLWEGQTDEGEIGMTYEEMDEIIYRIDYNQDLTNLEKNQVEEVQRLIRVNKHKLEPVPKYSIKK